MTEPEKKGGMGILDEVDEEPKKNGNGFIYFWVFLLVSIGAFSVFMWGAHGKDAGAVKDGGGTGKTDINQDAQYGPIKDFAEKFTIMAFNVSYTDINHQVDKVGNLMSDNMMSYYQEAFLDPKWGPSSPITRLTSPINRLTDQPWRTRMETITGSG